MSIPQLVDGLKAENATLTARIAELEAQLSREEGEDKGHMTIAELA
jgi:BMFP domain-containing protein YqiC